MVSNSSLLRVFFDMAPAPNAVSRTGPKVHIAAVLLASLRVRLSVCPFVRHVLVLTRKQNGVVELKLPQTFLYCVSNRFANVQLKNPKIKVTERQKL